MKREMVVYATIFLLLSTLTLSSPATVKGKTDDVSFVIKTDVTYYNNGTENWVLTGEDRTIGLFMNNTWQTVRLISHSHPIEEVALDEDGNPIAVLHFPKTEIEPGGSINYAVEYHVLSKPRSLPESFSILAENKSGNLGEIPEELVQRYCGEGDSWLVNDGELQELANSIAPNASNVLTIIKGFVAWMTKHIVYPIPGRTHRISHENPLYPNETLEFREGDCDDQAILFITLCRIRKIPSYLQTGFVYLPKLEANETRWEGHARIFQKGMAGHGWAMTYVPPWGWLPVDLTSYDPDSLFFFPLYAIEGAAVTSQSVIQYMNANQMDYVASNREAENFLKNNSFYVYASYIMIQALPENPLGVMIEELFLWILIAVVAVLTTAAFIFVRRERRLKRQNPNLVRVMEHSNP